MILEVFNGNLGLPTMDIKSLQMMTFAKFMKMDIKIIKRTLKPYSNSKLPQLICEKGIITDLEDYIDYLKFEAGSNTNLSDRNLTKLDKRYKPYEILFQETLKPALLNLLWSDETNYCQKVRGIYSKISCFPLNYFVPSHLRKQAINYLESVYPKKYRKEYFDIELIEKAKQVLKLLSDDLSNSKYFNGTSPNEIDALIFGYLAVILKIELPKLNNLQQFIKENQNLTDYVNRILNKFFSDDVELDETKLNDDKIQILKKKNLEKASWKSIILVSTIAVITNFVYILYLISHNESDEDEEDDEEEENDNDTKLIRIVVVDEPED